MSQLYWGAGIINDVVLRRRLAPLWPRGEWKGEWSGWVQKGLA
jgi:hypothetical protein